MSLLKEFKCNICGGRVEFSPEAQSLRCVFCGKEYIVEEFEETDVSSLKHKDNAEEIQSEEQFQEIINNVYPTSSIKEYICLSCGGGVVVEDTLAATKCPFCGNNIVVNERFNGVFKPDLVLPFKITKEEAKKVFKNYLSGKYLLHNSFKEINWDKEIKGVYIPYWLFSANNTTEFRAHGIEAKRTVILSKDLVECRHYDVERELSIDFKNIPVDASRTMDNKIMELLEPFHVSAAVPYAPQYLAGFYAHTYDVSKEECEYRAKERMCNTAKMIAKTKAANYNSFEDERYHIEFANEKAKHVLYPVYIVTIKLNNQTFMCAVNGQNGFVAGNLPVDKNKKRDLMVKTFMSSTLIVLAILKLLTMSI